MELHIIKYCAEECYRQGSGEISVYDMCNAWEYASNYRDPLDYRDNPPITLDFIEHLGKLVEPEDNKDGFRRIPIGVNDPNFGWIEKANWERIPDLLTLLLNSYYEGKLSPDAMWAGSVVGFHPAAKTTEDQFYYEYENIHPFRDGNGRTGKILYNYLCGTLDNPIMPPNFWNAFNP